MKRSLTIVIPVLNEEEALPKLFKELERIEKVLQEFDTEVHFFFSDNHSTDSSWQLISIWVRSKPNARAVQLSRNYGYQNSLLNSFSMVETEALVIYQADMQDPIDLIPVLLIEWQRGAKAVAGQISKRQEKFFDRSSRRIFYSILNWASDTDHPIGIQDFYLIDKSVYKEISRSPRQYQFIRSKISTQFKFEHLIPYERTLRSSGETKFDFNSKLNLAFDGFLSNSVNLRKRIVGFALFCSCISIISFVGLILAFVLGWRTVIGWTSLASLQFFAISIISSGFALVIEILGRLYNLEVNPVNIRIKSDSRELNTYSNPEEGQNA